MSNVVHFPRHKQHVCTDSHCFVCRGGLFSCDTCGGGEGSLTTDCPGGRMDMDSLNAVYDGTLDYVASVGWIQPAHSAWRKRR